MIFRFKRFGKFEIFHHSELSTVMATHYSLDYRFFFCIFRRKFHHWHLKNEIYQKIGDFSCKKNNVTYIVILSNIFHFYFICLVFCIYGNWVDFEEFKDFI